MSLEAHSPQAEGLTSAQPSKQLMSPSFALQSPERDETGFSERDRAAMRYALCLAKEAAQLGETPIGAVILAPDGTCLAACANRREMDHDISAHAEVLALREAGRQLQTWRLEGCTLYVTLEPCGMCAAAIQQARIAEVVFASRDPKAGMLLSVDQAYQRHPLFHQPLVLEGLFAEEASELLRHFFRALRQRNKHLDKSLGGRGRRHQLRYAGQLPYFASAEPQSGEVSEGCENRS